MKKWYSDCYRRNLVDMHIADPAEDADWQGDKRFADRFLSKFSPEDYVENLKRAHIQAPMLYLQAHTGHCYFPTKVGHMHSAFRNCPDKMRRLAELCRKNGMYVVGYYSLIYNSYEEARHPEWRLITGKDGSSNYQRGDRYGLCCPNNPEYRAFVEAQIREMADYFTLDGMFYDMTFWPGICRCSYCMEHYRKAGLKELPQENWADEDFRRLAELRIESMGEFAEFVTNLTHKYMPGVSVEHNYAHAVAADSSLIASTELVNEQCDYTGGDLYGDLYNHSFTAKYYYSVTKNQPFEYMTVRCDRTLQAHTNSKTREALMTEVMLTTAHHGASLIIDAIDPVGTLDQRVYDRIGEVFEREMPYEKYFSGEMLTDVGIYYSTTGRYNRHGYAYTSKTCSIGAMRAMIEAHIPVGIVSNATTHRLDDYQLVVAPAIAGISEQNRADLVAYVRKGGRLYLSGVEDEALLKQLLGAELTGFTEETAVYLAPTTAGQELFGEFNRDFPLPGEMKLPVLALDQTDCRILATMKLPYTRPDERKFASIHSNPPGVLTRIPALLVKKVGEGQVIWSALPLENDGRLSHKRIFADLIRAYMKQTSLFSTAPRQVELVSFCRPHDLLVSAVDLLCTDELLPIRSFTVSVKTSCAPAGVSRVADQKEVPMTFTYQDGYATFTVEDMVMFDMFRIAL